MSAFENLHGPVHDVLDVFLDDVEAGKGANYQDLIEAISEIIKRPKAPDGWRLTGEIGTHGKHLLSRCDKDGTFIYYIMVPDNVYGKPLEEVLAPVGFVKTGEFREPVGNEYFRTRDGLIGKVGGIYGATMSGSDRRRLILRRPERHVFEETGEERLAKSGEFYLGGDSGVYQANYDYLVGSSPMRILRKLEPAS